MQTKFLICPHCSASLRIRDRRFIGRPIPCPDCEAPVLIQSSGPQEFSIQAANGVNASTITNAPVEQSPAPARDNAPAAQRPKASTGQIRPGQIKQWLANPIVLAWCLAIAMTMVVVTLLLNSYLRSDSTTIADNKPAEISDDSPTPTLPAIEGTRFGEQKKTTRDSLAQLGKLIDEFYQQQQQFPTGSVVPSQLPPDQRLSWLATLVGTLNKGEAPHWDRSWNNVTNNQFVQRRVPAFQNPALDNQNKNSQPVSHFAGVAGLGADAATLPVSDERAGVFGYHRRVRQADIKDGTANTMMVTGVTNRTGHWAAAGHPTLRALTAEPYVNGPDGLSTGDAESMQVLMADGSVRTISSDADPRLVRGLATIAGNETSTEPGDPQTPLAGGNDETEPADNPPRLTVQTKPPLVADPLVAPLPPDVDEPLLAENVPVVDVQARLAQPILKFDQSKPIAISEMLFQLEEMTGVSIVADSTKINESLLKKTVSFQLAQTTTGQILERVLSTHGLSYQILDNKIHLVPAPR